MIGLAVFALVTIGALRVVKVASVGCRALVNVARDRGRRVMTRVTAADFRLPPDGNMTALALCALVAVLVAMRGGK